MNDQGTSDSKDVRAGQISLVGKWLLLTCVASATICLVAWNHYRNNTATEQVMPVALHEGSYYPVQATATAVVAQHLFADGSKVEPKQQIIALHPAGTNADVTNLSKVGSTVAGIYFALAGVGSRVQPAQTMALVLQVNPEHLYFFSVPNDASVSLKAGQRVTLMAGSQTVQGKVHSVVSGGSAGKTSVGITLAPPYDFALFHPSTILQLMVSGGAAPAEPGQRRAY